MYLCGSMTLFAEFIIVLIIPISHDQGEFELAILYSLFAYLLIILFAFSVALNLISIPTFSLRTSSSSELSSMIDAIVVCGGNDNGDLVEDTVVSFVMSSNLRANFASTVDDRLSMMGLVFLRCRAVDEDRDDGGLFFSVLVVCVFLWVVD